MPGAAKQWLSADHWKLVRTSNISGYTCNSRTKQFGLSPGKLYLFPAKHFEISSNFIIPYTIIYITQEFEK
jgi:hypothetical protein